MGQFGLTPWNTGYTPCKPGVPPLLVLSCSCHQPRGSHTAPPTPPSAPCPGTAPLHQPTLHGSPLPPGQKPSLTSKHLQGSPRPPFPPPFSQPRHPLLITLCSFSSACCCFQTGFSASVSLLMLVPLPGMPSLPIFHLQLLPPASILSIDHLLPSPRLHHTCRVRAPSLQPPVLAHHCAKHHTVTLPCSSRL